MERIAAVTTGGVRRRPKASGCDDFQLQLSQQKHWNDETAIIRFQSDVSRVDASLTAPAEERRSDRREPEQPQPEQLWPEVGYKGQYETDMTLKTVAHTSVSGSNRHQSKRHRSAAPRNTATYFHVFSWFIDWILCGGHSTILWAPSVNITIVTIFIYFFLFF